MPLDVLRMTRGVHAAREFDAAVALYEGVFGARVIAPDYLPPDREPTRASMLLIGSTALSVFSPREPGSIMATYIAKYGEGFHSIEWAVPDLDRAADLVEAAGVRLMFRRWSSFFTHPRDARGVMMQLTATPYSPDPRDAQDWSDAWWRDEHPLGIDRLNAVVCAAEDPAGARRFFEQVVGARVLGQIGSGDAERIFLWFGDTLVELRRAFEVDGKGPLGARGLPGIQAFAFRVRDLETARRHLTEHGLRCVEDAPSGGLLVDPAQTFGAVFGFSEEPIPGDPRTVW